MRTHHTIRREGVRNYIAQNYGKVKNVYNETITLFFIHMVHTAILQVRGGNIYDAVMVTSLQSHGRWGRFEEFLEVNPHLSDPKLLARHYSPSRVHSNEAQNRYGTQNRYAKFSTFSTLFCSWIEPDIKPLPREMDVN